jgi:hypothetical protein
VEFTPTTQTPPPVRSTYNVSFNLEELSELVKLIDDEDNLDEVLLSGLRRKLAHKAKLLRSRIRKAAHDQDAQESEE